MSCSAGDVSWHRGPSFGRMNELFGIRHQLDVGLAGPIEDDEVRLTFTRDFGGLAKGTTLTFAAGGNAHVRTFLPVVPETAEVIATDGHGRPALLRQPAGNVNGAGDLLVRDDGTRFAVLASHAAEKLTVRPETDGGGTLTTLDGSTVDGGVSTDPFGIMVLENA